MDYGSLGLDGFGFDALDAIAGAAGVVLPVGLGTATSFGIAEGVQFLVTNDKVRKWKWAIGFLGSLLLGAAMWKFRGPTDGALTIGSGLFASAVGWGHEELIKYRIKKAGGALPAGFGRYQVEQGQPLFQGRYVVEDAQPLFAGRYVVADAEPLLAGLGQMDRSEIVSLANGMVNPGVFG
jgi:hypothetical protein